MPDETQHDEGTSACVQAVLDVSNALQSVVMACTELREQGLLRELPEPYYHELLVEGSRVIGIMSLNLGNDYLNGQLPSDNPLVAAVPETPDGVASTEQWARLFVLRAASDVYRVLEEAEE